MARAISSSAITYGRTLAVDLTSLIIFSCFALNIIDLNSGNRERSLRSDFAVKDISCAGNVSGSNSAMGCIDLL